MGEEEQMTVEKMINRRLIKVKDGENKPKIWFFKDQDSKWHTSRWGRLRALSAWEEACIFAALIYLLTLNYISNQWSPLSSIRLKLWEASELNQKLFSPFFNSSNQAENQNNLMQSSLYFSPRALAAPRPCHPPGSSSPPLVFLHPPLCLPRCAAD